MKAWELMSVLDKTNHNNLSEKYAVLDACYYIIDLITITNKDLYKNNIPNIDSVLKYSDNIHHILKIINIFKLINKINLKEIISNNKFSFNKITNNAIEFIEIMKKKNKKKILKSTKSTGFYIRIYNDHGKAFFIDKKTNLIFYICYNIDFNNMNIKLRFYTFNIQDELILNNII
jgi:hypothetical protein